MLRRRAELLSVLLIAVAVLTRFGAHLSMDSAIIEHDWYTMHGIDAVHVQQAFQEGKWMPSWSPSVLGGSPLWGVSTKPFSYPPFLLAVWTLGAYAAMNVLLLLHVFLGAVGSLLLAKRLNLKGLAPLFCGLLFVLARFPSSGFQATPYGFGYAITWWPFFLIALLDLLEDRGTVSASLRLALFAALPWHAGGQPSLYWLACFSVVFALLILKGCWSQVHVGKLAGGGLLVLLAFLGLIAVKLLPEVAWLDSSGRGIPLGMELSRDSALEEELLRNGSFGRLHNLGLVLTQQYAGAGGWVLTLGSLLALARVNRSRTLWATAAATLFVFALASGALHELAYEWLPGYDRMRRHSRFVHMVGFGWILLAAHGLQFQLKSLRAWTGATCLVLLVFADTSQLPGIGSRPEPALRSSTEQRELYGQMIAPARQDPRIGRLQQAHRAQSSWAEWHLEGSGGALGGPNSGNPLYHQFLPEHLNSQVLQAEHSGALDVMNVRYLISAEPIVGEGLQLVSRPGALPPTTYQRLRELDLQPLFVYNRETARARVCTVSSPVLLVGEETLRREHILSALQSKSHRAQSQVFVECPTTDIDALATDWAEDFPKILFVGSGPQDEHLIDWAKRASAGELRADKRGTLWLAQDQSPTQVTCVEDSRHSKDMHSIQVNVQDLNARLLLLSERTTLDPGWAATIDGVPANMLRADGLVTMLRLPAGARIVRLQYTAPGRSIGLWISCITSLLIAMAAFQLRSLQSRRAALDSGELDCTV